MLANFCETVEVIPAVNQVELHPFFTQEDAIALMKEYGVVPQAWGPLAEGKHGIFTDPDLTAIGEKYGKSAAQVVLRWNIQRGVSILPKTTHVERMEQNIDIWDFELTEDEMKKIGEKDLGRSELINHFDPQLVKIKSPIDSRTFVCYNVYEVAACNKDSHFHFTISYKEQSDSPF